MATDPNQSDLRDALGKYSAGLDFLGALDHDSQKQLAVDIRDADDAHDAHIREKLDESLQHVPRLLRAVLKKAFRI